MKKVSFVFLFVILTDVFTGVVNAAGWTPVSKVEIVYAHSQHGGYGVFKLNNMSYNSDNCPNPVYYVVSKQNNPVFSEIYSLLLAAKSSGHNVQLWVSGCSPHNHPEIQHAKIVE